MWPNSQSISHTNRAQQTWPLSPTLVTYDCLHSLLASKDSDALCTLLSLR